MEVSWAERTAFHRAWSLASVSSARRLSAVKGVPRAAAIPLGTISSQPHQGSVTFRACEHRWLTEPGYVARVAAPGNSRLELELVRTFSCLRAEPARPATRLARAYR